MPIFLLPWMYRCPLLNLLQLLWILLKVGCPKQDTILKKGSDQTGKSRAITLQTILWLVQPTMTFSFSLQPHHNAYLWFSFESFTVPRQDFFHKYHHQSINPPSCNFTFYFCFLKNVPFSLLNFMLLLSFQFFKLPQLF